MASMPGSANERSQDVCLNVIGPDLEIVLGLDDEPRSVYLKGSIFEICKPYSDEEIKLSLSAQDRQLCVSVISGDECLVCFRLDAEHTDHLMLWANRYTPHIRGRD